MIIREPNGNDFKLYAVELVSDLGTHMTIAGVRARSQDEADRDTLDTLHHYKMYSWRIAEKEEDHEHYDT